MPTARYGWVRRSLRDGRAKVVSRVPFTIQLLYDSTDYTQEITLGVDAGSKTVGVSATTEKKELFAAEVQLRTDITELVSDRASLRRGRRSRKTRYRPARWRNRRVVTGSLPPSVRWKVEAHKRVIAKLHKFLPIGKIVVETAQFDIQKINNPEISGVGYQHGDQLGFQNVREYVLARDGHKCQRCGKSQVPLHVHHIESRQTGGDAPNNLVTLCIECHDGIHRGSVQLHSKRGRSFRDATQMTVMRPTLLKVLREIYPDVIETFGYMTKYTRRQHNMEKSHVNDAMCISGNVVTRTGTYLMKFVRRHNRQIHKLKIQKGNVRKRNNADKYVHGYQLFDMVEYNGQIGFVFGRRQRGQFDIRTLGGRRIAETSFRRLKLIRRSSTLLMTVLNDINNFHNINKNERRS